MLCVSEGGTVNKGNGAGGTKQLSVGGDAVFKVNP